MEEDRLETARLKLLEGERTAPDICQEMNIPLEDFQHYLDGITGKNKSAREARDLRLRMEIVGECQRILDKYEIGLEVMMRFVEENTGGTLVLPSIG
jgi:hypothetical protein